MATVGLVDDQNSSTIATIVEQKSIYVQYLNQLESMPLELIKAVTLIVYVTGICANLLLISYLIRYKRYKSPTFTLILSLAFADFTTCFGATFSTFFILYILEGPNWLCGFLVGITCWGYDNSCLHLILFSIMRFYQLSFPLKARAVITPRLICKCCLVFWPWCVITSAFISTYYVPVVFVYRGRTVKICTHNENSYQLFMETFYELIPTILIVGFHLAKYCVLKRGSGGKAMEAQDDQKKRQSTTDTRALVIIIVVYCLTAWPQLIHFYAHFVFHLPNLPAVHVVFNFICISLEFGNSAINPFIYVFCAGTVRRDIIKMIRCTGKQ